MSRCPSCESTFDTERGMKIHHKQKHGESLVQKTTTCEVTGCDNTFTYYPSDKEGKICNECVSSGESIWSVESISNEDLVDSLSKPDSVKLMCHWCEDSFFGERRKRKRKTFCSDSCRSKYQSKRMTGEQNPRYIDGTSSGANYGSTWRSVKSKALNRDNHECVICDFSENLHVHHITPVRNFEKEEDAHYLKNAVTLCASCHRHVEYGNKSIPESYITEYNLEEYDGPHLDRKV